MKTLKVLTISVLFYEVLGVIIEDAADDTVFNLKVGHENFTLAVIFMYESGEENISYPIHWERCINLVSTCKSGEDAKWVGLGRRKDIPTGVNGVMTNSSSPLYHVDEVNNNTFISNLTWDEPIGHVDSGVYRFRIDVESSETPVSKHFVINVLREPREFYIEVAEVYGTQKLPQKFEKNSNNILQYRHEGGKKIFWCVTKGAFPELRLQVFVNGKLKNNFEKRVLSQYGRYVISKRSLLPVKVKWGRQEWDVSEGGKARKPNLQVPPKVFVPPKLSERTFMTDKKILSTSFTLSNEDDGKEVKCVYTLEDLTDTVVYTDTISMTAVINYRARFIGCAKQMTMVQGDASVTMNCTIKSRPDSLHISWKKPLKDYNYIFILPGKKYPNLNVEAIHSDYNNNTEEIVTSLIFYDVSLNQHGKYKLQVENYASASILDISVIVEHKPIFDDDCATKSFMSQDKTSETMDCMVKARPSPTSITWVKKAGGRISNDIVIESNSSGTRESTLNVEATHAQLSNTNETKVSLTFINVNLDHYGQYELIVKNRIGTSTLSISVIESYKPNFGDDCAKKLTLSQGQTPVTMDCTVRAQPNPTSITWTLAKTDETRVSLTFYVVDIHQDGRYDLIVENDAGTDTLSIVVTVKLKVPTVKVPSHVPPDTSSADSININFVCIIISMTFTLFKC